MREGLPLTFQFNHFDREVFLPHTKYFKIAEYRLLRFSMTIHFDTKEIAPILPVDFAL